MSDYFADIAWGTIANSVLPYYDSGVFQLNEYTLEVYPLDRNEPGADSIDANEGNYFIDYLGYPWVILEVTTLSEGLKLRVRDVNERSISEVIHTGPYPNKIGYVYKPTKGAVVLAQAQLLKLDTQARDRINNIEKGVIWENLGGDNIFDSVIAMQEDSTLDPGAAPTLGDRYIILDYTNLNTNFGTITNIGDNDIVEYDGSDFIIEFDASVAISSITVTVTTDTGGNTNELWFYNTIDVEWQSTRADINYWTKEDDNLHYIGKVGINVNPSELFEIKSTAVSTILQKYTSSTGVSIGRLTQSSGNGGNLYISNNSGDQALISADSDSYIKGDTGFGHSSPTEKVDILGNIKVSGTTKFNSIAYTWPSADGTNDYVLTTNGAGTLTWSQKTGSTTGTITSINGSSEAAQTLIGGIGITVTDSGTGSYIHTINASLSGINYWTKTGSNLSYTAGSVGIGNYLDLGIQNASGVDGGIRIYSALGTTALSSFYYDVSKNKWTTNNDLNSLGDIYSTEGLGENRLGSNSSGAYLQGKDSTGDSNYLLRSYGSSYLLGGDVGIGIVVPTAKLHLYEATNEVKIILQKGTSTSTWQHTASGSAFLLKNNSNITNVLLTSYSDSYFNGGNVAIGKTSALSELNINGTLVIDSGTRTNPTGNASMVVDYQSTLDRSRIRSRNWDGAMWKNISIEANDIIMLPNNYMGINTETPLYTLDVNGTGRFTGNLIVSTQSTSDNSTKAATTAFVKNQGYITGNQTITLSGDVTGSGTTSITTIVGNDSHSHTGSTISGLTVSDFTSTNISQWTNNSGYTTNTGTVTSVSGTGTVSGLTLSGSVTSTGNLTLGGQISLASSTVRGGIKIGYNGGTPLYENIPVLLLSEKAYVTLSKAPIERVLTGTLISHTHNQTSIIPDDYEIIPYATATAWSLSSYENIYMYLTGDTTITLSNVTSGQSGIFLAYAYGADRDITFAGPTFMRIDENAPVTGTKTITLDSGSYYIITFTAYSSTCIYFNVAKYITFA